MKISVRISIPANFCLLLSTTFFIVAALFSPTIRQIVLFSTKNLFYIHFLFNFILVSIFLLKKYSSDNNHGDMASVSKNVNGIGTDAEYIINIGSCDEDSDGYYSFSSDADDDDIGHGSEGYDEDDDDDNGSYGEIGWDEDEEEEYDFDLERRAEEFIAKVINGWREEWYRDNFDDY